MFEFRDCQRSSSQKAFMQSVKDQVVRIVRSLPDDATIDDVMNEIYFKMQVDAGLKELDEGKGIPHEKVEERMSKWLSR